MLSFGSCDAHTASVRRATGKHSDGSRIVLLGPGGVGKSCLSLQHVHGQFVDQYECVRSSDGAEPQSDHRGHVPQADDVRRDASAASDPRSVDGTVFDCEIIDSAGVEQFT